MNTSTTSPETPTNTLSTRGFTEGNYEDLIKIKADRLKKLNEDLQIDKEDLKIYLHEFYPYDEYRIKKLYANDTMSEEESSDNKKPKSENDDGYGKDDYEKDDNDSNGGGGGRSKVGMFNPETGEFESFEGMDKFGKNKPKKTNDFVVRAFGIVKFPDGREHSISFDVLDFKPYFYIKIPDNWTKAQFANLIMKLKDEAKIDPKSTYSYANGLIKWEIYTGKPFYGFTADDKFQYGKLIFENSNTFKKYSRLLETLATHKSKAWAEHVLYESNIEPQLRLIHIQEITPSGWIKVPAGKYRRQPYNSSDCEFHFELSQTDIIPLNECSDIPKLKVAAFDIESDSSHGDFPIAAKNYRKLSQDIITEFLKLPADQIKNIKNSHHIKALIHTWISLAFNPYYDNNNISKIVTKNDEIPSEETLEYLAEKIKDLGDQYHQTIMDIVHHGYNPNKVHGYKEYYIGKLHLELEEHLPELDMERIGTGNYQLLAEQLLKENHRMMEGHKKVYLKEPLETIKFWLMLAYHPYYDQHNISHVYNVGKSSPTMAKLENLVPQIYSICMECYWELNKPKEKKPKSMAVIKPKKFMVTPPQAGQTKLTGLLKRTMESRKSIETDVGADGSGKKAGEADKKKKKELAAVADKKKKDLAVATESDGGSGYKAGGGKEEEQLIFTRGRYVKPRPVPYPDPDNPEKMKIDKIGRDFFVEWLHELFDHHLPDVLGDPVIQIGTTFKMYGEKELYLKHIITLKGCAKFTNEQMIDDENKDIFITKPKDALAEADSLGFTSDTVKSIAKRLKEAEEKGIKKPEIPKEEIQQINTELYLARRNKQMARDTSVLKVECYNTEAEVLLAWKRLIKEQDPDIITGYNIFGFDFKYMWDRAQVLGIIEDFSDLGRIRRFPEELVEKKLVSSGLGDNLLYYISMTGRVTIDLLKVVQSGGYRLPIYKLDFVCNHFLYKRKNDLPPQELFILQKGSDQDRAKIARYCLVDCILCNRLLDKLEIITNNVGMSRVCKVPLNYLFLRGQGIKIQSLVSDITRKEGYLIKTKERITGNGTDDWFEGAIVLDPAKGIYFEPCVVADFNSLYPSCMIAWNLSHDSYIELGSKYDNLPEGQYYDVKYDLYREEKMPGRKVVRRVKYGVKTCRYYQPADGSKSMLPRILQKLLKARKSTREEQEAFKKGTFEWNVKEGLQLAYKVTANSLYGQVGARTSAISFKEIAACTTACGRDLIYKSKEFAETNYEGCQTVYGDTDSCFFRYNTVNCRGEKLFGLDAIYKSIELCTETALGITRTLPKPHNLEFEKAIWPFMLLSKKRYHGHYWTKWGKCDYYPNSMGIVLKRRDNAKIVKHIFGGVLDIIMEEHDIKKAIEFCKVESAKLLEGKFPIEMFTITKTLKSYYKNPDQIAHNVLAQRIAERDPGNRVQSNDRMEFAYIKLPEPPKGVKILQGDKIETPQFIKTKDLPLDYRHYLTNQVMKPVTQIFELVLDEKELAGIFGEALMEYDRRASGFQRITKWVRQIPIFPDPEDDGDSEGDQDGHGGGGSDEDEEFGNVPAYGIIQKLLKQLKKEEEDENAEPGHFEAKEGDEVLVH